MTAPTNKGLVKGYTFYEYDGMTMSSGFPASSLDKIKQTALHDDDIVVATYPKCGTTWMQEIVYLVKNDGVSGDKPSPSYWYFLEAGFGPTPSFERYVSLPPPHLVMTHLSTKFYQKTLNESKTKIIVVLRNPKDALVSYYHFYRSCAAFDFPEDGSWDDFFQIFKEKKVSQGDIFDVQMSWWKLRNDPRVEVFKFEDMLKSPEQAVRRVMKHLGKSLSDEVVQEIVQKTSFNSMKNNPLANKSNGVTDTKVSAFMRKGKVGDWKNHFNKEQAAYVDELSAKIYEPEGLLLEDE